MGSHPPRTRTASIPRFVQKTHLEKPFRFLAPKNAEYSSKRIILVLVNGNCLEAVMFFKLKESLAIFLLAT